jgi:hypothetical protein
MEKIAGKEINNNSFLVTICFVTKKYYFCNKLIFMKKIITLLSIFLLTIASCTKDNDAEKTILPNKIILSDGSNTDISTITYIGNKIETIAYSDGHKFVYTYTGDQISKVTSYEGNTIIGTIDYIYQNNNLKSSIENYLSKSTGVTTNHKLRTVYTYNSDGTILEERYSTDPNTAIETKTNNSTYTFANGNLTKEINTYTYFNGTTNTSVKNTTVYEYDNKKNPSSNILGLNKIEFSDTSSLNNIIKRTISSESTTDGIHFTAQPDQIRNYILSYDANNFLKERKYNDTNSNSIPTTFTTQYFYE